MQSRSLCALALGLSCWSASGGCSPGEDALPPEPVLQPVKGKVSVQGEPLAHAVITFLQADEKGTTGVGETDGDGEYEMSHLERPGVAAADYKVAVSYIQGIDGTVYGLAPRSGLAKPYGLVTGKERIPEEWSNLGKTTQRVTVPVGGGEFNFDIKEPLLSPPEPPKDQPKDATAEAKPAPSETPPAASEPKKDAPPEPPKEATPAPEAKPGA